MTKEETTKVTGIVEQLLPNAWFLVTMSNGKRIRASLCGKMKLRRVRVLLGDSVDMEISPYDRSKARIVYRHT